MKLTQGQRKRLDALRGVLDAHTGRYQELAGVPDVREYLNTKPDRDDEEILTEEILKQLMEKVLGFPPDAYFPQFSRGGLKPDLTPKDPIAHPFVLDAKSSLQANLDAHEGQIREYVKQRNLRFGVLFNLREVRVYRREQSGADPNLSFLVLPLWELARGEAFAEAELVRFEAFLAAASYRTMGDAEKLRHVREAASWQAGGSADVRVDIDFLVDQLRDLSRQLTADAAASSSGLRAHLKLNPGREPSMLAELEALAQDLEPGTSPVSLPNTIEGYLAASAGLPARLWEQFLLRVAQLTLARIVLYRSWEDVGFADSLLYDGGFDRIYDELDESLRRVLERAFAEGLQRYPWLYGRDNNYDWYRPSDPALLDVLYSLTPFPLGKLDADVLGGLYESYVDEIDRDRLGQFYTPRAVVRFMLDRAGFSGPEVFRLEGDERKPRDVLDFATGSGGFVVEAARRLLDESGVEPDDLRGLEEALAAIVLGIHGCEISPFPYYLTEINLLLQVSRLLGRIATAGGGPPPQFSLGVVHADTLVAKTQAKAAIEGLDAEHEGDVGALSQDEHFSLVPLDAEKQTAFDRVREDASFDLVVGNPPYVFETNNRLLFERLRHIPAWDGVYRGKSDYLYYFLLLAAEKVRAGGRLCVITPAGWMNAGNAEWLRERMASTLRLDELYLFGSYRLFAPEREARARRHRAPTPTVESAILVATKAKPRRGHKLRIVALEDEAQAARELSGNPEAAIPERDALLDEMAVRGRGKPGRRKGFHVLDVPQADLVHDRPWPIKHAAGDVAARVVAHLDGKLAEEEGVVEPLAQRWAIAQGVQTGADAYTPRIERRLRNEFPEAKAELDRRGAQLGDPIMELPAGREKDQPWSEHPEVLARSIEPDAILYGAMDGGSYTSLVWLGRGDEAPREVVEALEPWKPVLMNRAEIARNPKRRWWETAWPRSKEEFRKPKVIALYRTDRGRFALDETGDWQPSIKTTLAIPKEDGLSVVYLCGLLNSELLDLWYVVRGKTPRDIWRNYEPKPMARMPYRHVPESEPARTDRLDALGTAIEEGSADAAGALAVEIAAEAREDEGAAPEAKRALEAIVRAIAANRTALLAFRGTVPSLERIVKDPWRAPEIGADPAAVLAELPEADKVSVRIDAELSCDIASDGALGRPVVETDGLVMRRARKVTARVSGRRERLELLADVLSGAGRIFPPDLLGALLPKEVDAFNQRVLAVESEVAGLLHAGRDLVTAAEWLVCSLYGLDVELTDEVVAHAEARAAGREDVA